LSINKVSFVVIGSKSEFVATVPQFITVLVSVRQQWVYYMIVIVHNPEGRGKGHRKSKSDNDSARFQKQRINESVVYNRSEAIVL